MSDTVAFPSSPPLEVPVLPWPKQHIGCNAALCPNGKCRATGECIELAAERARQSERHGG